MTTPGHSRGACPREPLASHNFPPDKQLCSRVRTAARRDEGLQDPGGKIS